MTFSEATATCESFADVAPRPTNWEGAMQAVVAGTIDHDEIGDLIWACAEAADDVLAARKVKSLFQWREFARALLRGPLSKGQSPGAEVEAELVNMGQVADLAEQGALPATA